MSGKVRTVTLGCKVNQYETQLVRDGLLSIGYSDAIDDESADLCIVNTCTVTNEGDAKSRQTIRRLHRANPNSRIVVMGCYATRAPDEVAKLPGVSEVVTDKRELPDLMGRFGVIDIPQGVKGLDGRSRAYVKVQDGCLLRCSYCIIPAVRPEMYSRPLTNIVDEVSNMVAAGVGEVVLTGIHLGHYGVDFNLKKPKSEWTRLADLVRTLCRLPGDFRIRLSSIEATEVTNELLNAMSEFPERICPHLHICLQSGSDAVLHRMKRRWGAKRFVDRCKLVADRLDRPAISTDVIVGFPGETEQEFQETMAVCKEVGFSKIHAFPFSARKGTAAAEYPNQVAKSIKKERIHALTELESQTRSSFFDRLVGKPLKVLVENTEAGVATGTSCRYSPTEFETQEHLTGQLVKVLASENKGTFVTATKLSESV